MRILFIDQTGQLGGAELCLNGIVGHYKTGCSILLLGDGPFARMLRDQGYDVSVLAQATALAQVTKSASVFTLLRSLWPLAFQVLNLRKHMLGFELLYFNTPKALLNGVAANIGLSKPSVFHLHDILDKSHFSSINIRLLVAAANRTNAVIANSKATAQAFRAAGGCAPVHVIPNGFDATVYDHVSHDAVTSIRNEYNPQNKTVVAVFGRLSPWKGQDVLIVLQR